MIQHGLLLLLLHAPADFTRVEETDGVLVEARPVAGSRLVELRLTTTTRKSPESLCAAAFGDGKADPEVPDLKLRKVLSETDDERVTYEQVSPPMVAARDYASRARRIRSGEDACRVTFEAANEVAPPKPEGWVRITKLHGEWKFERTEDGLTRVTYLVFSDPGGTIPTFMLEGGRRKFALRFLKLIIRRGKE